MAFRTRWLAVAVVGAALVALPACGDDDDGGEQTTTPGATQTLETVTQPVTGTGTPGASPTEQLPPSRAEVLAQSAQYFIYEAGEGDTVESAANAFSASPDGASEELIQQILDENGLDSGDLKPGQKIGIPLILPGDLSMFAENSIEDALAIGQGQSGELVLLQPTLDMRSGFLGRMALHRVQLATGIPADEGYGYVMEYWITDRPPAKGGVIDPDARKAQRQFIVAGGSLAETLGSGDGVYTWEVSGVQYALKSFVNQPTPQELAEMLGTAAER
ncbi:MAG: LysM peptidoglycan-binding domain-containing protein [Dehalococcoidia bacterium]|nr:LysM peptidoglycan-binding domain-containing protein [Dehalococcoidia bacterium]